MTNTQWWLRIVGAFYLLLALGSCWALFINPQAFGAMFPFSASALSVRAFSEAWLIFVLEMGVLGFIMLYAARQPARNGITETFFSDSKEADMTDISVYKLGGMASIVVGISYAAVGITSALTPPSVAGVPDVQNPLMYFEENKFMILTNWWALLIGAVFALAMIPAVSATVQHLNEGWVRWTSTLATVAFAVVILDNYWSIVYTDAIAKAYTTGTEATRAALTVPGAPQWIDVKGWLADGAVGVWALVVSLLALRGNVWPKGLAYVGIGGGFIYFAALASWNIPDLFVSGSLIFTGVLGAVYAPIWYTWMGVYLCRMGSPEAK